MVSVLTSSVVDRGFESRSGQTKDFKIGSLVSSTNKTNCHDITEILLKVALNTTTPPLFINQALFSNASSMIFKKFF